MKRASRRSILKVVPATTVAAGLAGCSGDDGGNGNGGGNGGGNGDDSTPTASPTPDEPDSTEYFEVTSHEWLAASTLEIEYENKSDEELSPQVEANVYTGDTRIATGFVNITSLPPGTSESDQIRLDDYDDDPCEADRYDLATTFYYEERIQDRFEHEFDGDGLCE